MTHVRTAYRLIPTAGILAFGQVSGHPREVLVRDHWSDRLGGLDSFLMESEEAAARACAAISEALLMGPHDGPYIRLCPPGVPLGNMRWRVVIEERCGDRTTRSRVLGYDDRMSALAAFEDLCRDFDAIDLVGSGTGRMVH